MVLGSWDRLGRGVPSRRPGTARRGGDRGPAGWSTRRQRSTGSSPGSRPWSRTRPRSGWCWRPATGCSSSAGGRRLCGLPVNPDLVARRRGPARKKDDAEDARISCLLALDRHTSLRPLIPHGEVAGELRAIARDDERAARTSGGCSTGCAPTCIATFPAALVIAGDDLGAPTILRLLERWPTARPTRRSLARGADRLRPRRPPRLARPLRRPGRRRPGHRPLHRPRLLVRAKADTIRLTATQLLAIGAQRRVWERRMGELLLGAPRPGGPSSHQEDQPGQALPGGEIYLSFPGLGDRLAARVAGEIGDHPQQFESPNALQCYAGKAPVTRRSGQEASWSWPPGWPATATWPTPSSNGRSAACAARAGPGSSTTPSAPAARPTTPPCARSATAGWRSCGTASSAAQLYDEAIHIANRNRALGKAA